MKDFLGNEFNALSQMNALAKKLAIADIPFEIRGFPSASEWTVGTLQVCAPSIENPMIDVVCHGGSYGHETGLMEAMTHNGYAYEHDWGEDVRGWLDADEAFDLIVDVLNFHPSKAAE